MTWQVSLPSLGKGLRSGFPLSSLAVECSEQFGVDWEGSVDAKAGHFFALATAWASTKVGIRNFG